MSTPKRTKSSALPGQNVTNSDLGHFARQHFTLASVTALHRSLFALGHSNSERQAAARALLRHDSHLDGAHYHTRTPAGLHPSYIAFNEALTSPDEKMITHEEFVEATLQDIFDASVLFVKDVSQISCSSTLSAEHIAVDLYVTPRELHEAFCEEFAVPHLKHFTECCRIEGVQAPHRYPAAQVNPTGPQVLPAPLFPTSSHIQCSARPSKAFSHDFETHAITKSKHSSSAHQQSTVVQHAIALASGASTVPTGSPKARKRRYADYFLVPKNIKGTSTNDGPKQWTSGFMYSDLPRKFPVNGPPIISIGPHTDAVLDHFKMGDDVIPKLRELMSTVRSSRWEVILRSQKWDFTFEQAANLVKTLNTDLRLQTLDINPKVRDPLSSVWWFTY
ncbi:hypothetical protein C8R48DRAFT_675149 [Suillus tomentosus]|nr:hypothetical protein C8R48DRAFT_675149 [Suillus tomentosus]